MLPLAGVRILDLGRVVAAPFATQLLADLGADVIKVERPGKGDLSREYGPSYFDLPDGSSASGLYLSVNRNKKSVTIDIGSSTGRALILALAAKCDVLVENFKTGDLDKKGLGYGDVAAVHPGIVYCSITGFGHTGPYARHPATDVVFQSMSALMSVTGEADGAPQRAGIAVSDLVGGLYAANAIQAALRARDHDGRGQHIDLSLLDCSVAAMSARAADYFITGDIPVRTGNFAAGVAPAQLFECRDGLLNVQAGTDAQFHKLCAVVDRLDLVPDPRFASSASRVRHAKDLIPIFEQIFAQNTVLFWYEKLVDSGVICSPIYDMAGTFEDPQVKSRGLRSTLRRHDGVSLDFVRNPIRFSKTPIDHYSFPPAVGEHTDQVLAEVLEMTSAEIEALRSAGAV
ncbi:CaiB/BaiF CoA transferase family protein [Rhizorhabdus dicambivorans]|nr:CoA transferase [Rhizorhabdus dicambivorans]